MLVEPKIDVSFSLVESLAIVYLQGRRAVGREYGSLDANTQVLFNGQAVFFKILMKPGSLVV